MSLQELSPFGNAAGAPTRVLLLADRSDMHLRLAQDLHKQCGIVVTEHRTEPIHPADVDRLAHAPMLIATPASLKRLHSGVSLHLLRRTRMILLLTRERLLAAADYAPWADGFLFCDDGIRHICTAVQLAHQGHTLCPDYIGAGFTLDEARVQKLPDMSRTELDVLDCLAEGAPNMDIASQLGIPENEAKYTVRSILTKLRHSNRTEAGVFALRFHDAIQAHKHQH
mgnify:CR=1 FL=1